MKRKPKPVCKCDMRTKLVGDGCAVCNPEPEMVICPKAEKCPYRELWLVECEHHKSHSNVYGCDEKDIDFGIACPACVPVKDKKRRSK